MTFENLTGLIRGELLTAPAISSFEDFCFEAHKINRGDLFVAFNTEQIEQAVENGAYGILFDDEDINISDNEIAWIKVQNINMALFRLMRFESSYKKLNFVSVSLLQKNMLKNISLSNSIILPKNTLEAFKSIMKAPQKSFVFCSDDLYLQKIAPVHECIFKQKHIAVQKNGSIFSSSFIFENEYYHKIPISPIFISSFCGIIKFLKDKNIDFSLDVFKPIENFDPIFVDASIQPQSFGETRRALIVESDEELFCFEAKALLKTLPPNHLLICKPIDSKVKMEANFLYKSEDELKQLSEYNFKYALVLGDRQTILDALLKYQTKRYPSLF